MGWVGVAIVVATTCFLLYRHPPASWFPEPSPADQARTEPIAEEKATPQAPKDKARVSGLRNESRYPEAENEPIDDPQTTPKASPSTPANLEVPSFQLCDDSESSTLQKTQDDRLRLTTEPSGTLHSTASPTPTPTPIPIPTMAEPSPIPRPQAPAAKATSLMPPPPPPSRLRPPVPQRQPPPQQQNTLAPPAGRFPPPLGGRPSSNNLLSPPPSAAASLRVPPSTRPISNSLSPTQVTLKPAKKASQRPVLEPGYSPLDWAALAANPNNNLRGTNLPSTYIKVTPSMLKAQNGRKGMDAWTSYQGKVYNITPYLPFHPGGKGELLRGAGKDSGKLFLEIHPWVNWDGILGACLVGILVSENEAIEPNKLDEMD
ncbi:hypothetical protein BJX63DRAFT_412871 [Aspergillus granulosus]|uniref:Cytochrome b5 heme-binding domain-containing protein n=1 Tax=Aspergillus granulosus TaxID=176169 RepID=A0ABR4GXF9_9EURO